MSDDDWSQGYVTDTTYVDRFFRELSPTWLNYVAALNGIKPPDLEQSFTYLELGSGFSTSAIVNAGAFPQGEFHACDFNAAHIAGARSHATAIGIGNIQFHQASFQELSLLDLPPFDFIVAHGVYSWVGDEARQEIRRIIKKNLKPGGLVYLSYNCLPGWSVEVPLRKLLVELASGSSDTPQRTEHALRLMKDLSTSKLRYFNDNPGALTAVDSYIKGSSNYLAHEFLNQAWEPFYSIDVAAEMAEVGTSYVGSATLVDNHETLVVNDTAAQTVAKLQTSRQRQLAIDFAVNRRFRRDVFVRDTASRRRAEASQLNAVVIGSVDNPERLSARVTVPRGVITFQEDFIRDIQELMTRGSMTIGEAVAALAGAGRNAIEITRNLIFLVAAGALMPFAKTHDSRKTSKARELRNAKAERALAHIIEQQIQGAIPSEVLGNGVPIRPVEALALSELLAGADGAEALAGRLEAEILRLGLKIKSEGKELRPGVELSNYVRVTAHSVIENLLPSLKRLDLF